MLPKRASQIIIDFPGEQIRRVRETTGVSALERETQHFVGITSINGLLRIYRSKGKIRWFWVSVIILCIVILLHQSALIFITYLSRPTRSQEHSCLISLLYALSTLTRKRLERESAARAESFKLDRELNKTGDLSVPVLQYLLQSTSDVQWLYGSTTEEQLRQNEDALIDYVTKHPEFSIKKFFFEGGYKCSEMFKMCSFAGRKFDCCRYVKAVLTSYGRCQMLNLIDSAFEWMRKQKEEGVDSGLQMVLDAHMEEDLESFSTNQFENGFWYYVDEPSSDTYRGAEVQGISVSPGDRVYSSLAAYRYTLLDRDNWGNCSSTFPERFRTNVTVKYSSKDCVSICKAKFFHEQCGCSPFVYNIGGEYRSCTPLESIQCLKTHIVHNHNETTEEFYWPDCSECTMECDRWEYSAYNSYGRGMAKGAVNWIHAANTNVSKEHIKENYVAINVYYREMIYTLHRQMQDRTLTEVFSDLGGVMGLFLGLNLLTVIEMIIYFWKVLWIVISSKRREYLTEKKTREEKEEQERQNAVNCMRRMSSDILAMSEPQPKLSIGGRIKRAVQGKPPNNKVQPKKCRAKRRNSSNPPSGTNTPKRMKSARERFLEKYYEQRLKGNGMTSMSPFNSTNGLGSIADIREEPTVIDETQSPTSNIDSDTSNSTESIEDIEKGAGPRCKFFLPQSRSDDSERMDTDIETTKHNKTSNNMAKNKSIRE